MATVLARRDGRYEVRESIRTAAGPRGRTLTTFRVLSDQVLDAAERRATRPFDRARVRARAEALGVPDGRHRPAELARALVRELARGAHGTGPWPRVLAARLRTTRPAALPDSIPPALEWVAASPAERGTTLRQLLRLADRVPPRRPPGPLTFPRLRSSGPA